MEGIQNSLKQIGELWGSFSPSQKGTYTMIVLLLVAAPIIFSYKGFETDYESLLGNRLLTPNELRSVQNALINSAKPGARIEGMQIMVPAGRAEEYLKAIADSRALPPSIADLVIEGMKETSVLESPAHRRSVLAENLKKQTMETIREMQDVQTATVSWSSVDRRRNPFGSRAKRTGIVTVRMLGDRELTSREVHSMQLIVANRVQGLSPHDVAVMNLATGYTHNPSEHDAHDKYFRRLNEEESKLRQKIENTLSYIRDVVVTVKVELDKQEGTDQQKLTYDAKPVTIVKDTNTETKSSRENRPRGEPGNVANQPARNPQNVDVANQRDTETNRSTQQSVVGHKQEFTRIGGLRPVSSTATITIPESYYRGLLEQEGVTPPANDASEEDKSGYRAKVLAKETEQRPKVLAAVKPFLTIPNGEEPTEYISVVSAPQSPAPEPEPGPGMLETSGALFNQYSRTVGLVLFAMAALFMLNRSLKGAPPAPEPDIEAILNPTPPEEPDEPIREPEPAPPSRRDDVQFLVRDNPEMAASLLSKWLSS